MPKQTTAHVLNSARRDGSDSRSTTRQNVGDWERITSVTAGSLLGLTGLAAIGRTPVRGILMLGAGAALMYRGASGWCGLYDALGINHTYRVQSRASLHSGEGVRIEKSVVIAQSPAETYRFWRALGNLPQVMTHLEAVEELGEGRSHWIAKGPLGMRIEWDAEILEDKENELISWRSLPESDIAAAGSVRFEPAEEGKSTTVRVELRYSPPAGKLGDAVAKIFGEAPGQQIETDLENYARSHAAAVGS